MASKSIKVQNKSFDISYEIINSSCDKTIVFLHGWGSYKEIMKQAFSATFLEYKHIYIDMPGFGKSSNEYVLTTDEYAIVMQSFFEKLNISPSIIFGHSFGGKVATLLNPENLVLLSSAGIIEEKPFGVKVKIAIAKLLGRLGLSNISKVFRSKDVNSMSEEMYATFKNVVDEDFTNNFMKYKQKAYIFWGEEDRATSLQSGKKINNLIDNSYFKSYNGDHYFFLEHAKDIEKNIMENKI